MKLYLIRRLRFRYYEYDAHIVRADSEENARIEASKTTGDEPSSKWIDPKLSVCTVVSMDGPIETILSSFNAE